MATELPDAPEGTEWEFHGKPDKPWLWINELVDFGHPEGRMAWFACASAGSGCAFLVESHLQPTD